MKFSKRKFSKRLGEGEYVPGGESIASCERRSEGSSEGSSEKKGENTQDDYPARIEQNSQHTPLYDPEIVAHHTTPELMKDVTQFRDEFYTWEYPALKLIDTLQNRFAVVLRSMDETDKPSERSFESLQKAIIMRQCDLILGGSVTDPRAHALLNQLFRFEIIRPHGEPAKSIAPYLAVAQDYRKNNQPERATIIEAIVLS